MESSGLVVFVGGRKEGYEARKAEISLRHINARNSTPLLYDTSLLSQETLAGLELVTY
jgi:hypothetical protein